MSYFHNFNFAHKISSINMPARKLTKFNIGDILGLSFRSKGSSYFFEGICIALKNKGFYCPESSLILRNILSDVGVELTVSYFYNRSFFIKINSFKRKKIFYGRSKLYYVRNKLNRQSRII